MYLGIDVGTSGVKTTLIDDAQRTVGAATAPLEVSRPELGWSEQNPHDWIAATEHTLDALEHKLTRDALWSDMSRDNAASHNALWTDLTRRAPDEVRTPAATMLAFSAWLAGDGAKAWCTFSGRADVLSMLVRTDPDVSKAARGLSLFIVPKAPYYGHEWRHDQPEGGAITGTANPAPGYRGMHSFTRAIDNYWV